MLGWERKMADIANGFAGAVGTAGGLLQGAGEEQLKNKQLNQEQTTSGLNYIKDASGKAIDFMTQAHQQQGKLMVEQMKLEAEAERQKVNIAAKQTEQSQKLTNEKAKHDYENFATMTPELAEGLFKSTKGKIDFRRAVGQRIMTKVLVPLIQMAAGEARVNDKPPSDGKSQKDLNALKAFTSTYDKKKKDFDDPFKAMLAQRNPELQKRRDQDELWLRKNEGKYNESMKKIPEMGGIEDAQEEEQTVTPPANSTSELDAIIDAAQVSNE